jgi:hypothetical protein
LLIKAWTFAAFYLGPLLGIILLFGTFTIPYGASFRTFSRRTQFMLLLLLSVGIGAALPVFLNPHYIAAIACVIYLFVVRAMRRLGRWAPRGRQEGLAIVRLLCVTAVLVMIFHIVLPVGPVDGGIGIPTWCSPAVYDTPRREVEKKLLATDGKHLVIVHYEKDHSPIDEWVYNGADIDGSRIAWARDMGYEGNSELIRYFGDRKIWVAEPDHQSLSPYSPSSSSPK